MFVLINLGELKVGFYVNIEWVVKFGDEIGGYNMLGYIVLMVEILEVIDILNNCIIWFLLF